VSSDDNDEEEKKQQLTCNCNCGVTAYFSILVCCSTGIFSSIFRQHISYHQLIESFISLLSYYMYPFTVWRYFLAFLEAETK
jgi:hypothetical protein